MPTKREREYYRMGFKDAMQMLRERQTGTAEGPAHFLALKEMEGAYSGIVTGKRRKLSIVDSGANSNSVSL